jgi:hypothetical protein
MRDRASSEKPANFLLGQLQQLGNFPLFQSSLEFIGPAIPEFAA